MPKCNRQKHHSNVLLVQVKEQILKIQLLINHMLEYHDMQLIETSLVSIINMN